ncbi:MAG TPA: YdeI/OmpD-associated family protein [Caulobacteraceae bacterium]
MASDELPLLTFADAPAFEAWLAAQPDNSPGAWLRFAKKGASEPTISKSDAIDCALAHGWVDGQLGRIDDAFFKTRFTPRRPRSAWSQVNRQRVERLAAAGRISSRGKAQIDQAKADGRWAAAYAPQSQAAPDHDLETALDAEPTARAVFAELDSANRYAVLYRVHQAKTPDARATKIAELVAMLARGETIHPRRTRRG